VGSRGEAPQAPLADHQTKRPSGRSGPRSIDREGLLSVRCGPVRRKTDATTRENGLPLMRRLCGRRDFGSEIEVAAASFFSRAHRAYAAGSFRGSHVLGTEDALSRDHGSPCFPRSSSLKGQRSACSFCLPEPGTSAGMRSRSPPTIDARAEHKTAQNDFFLRGIHSRKAAGWDQ
jgi:hypothetical protein